MKAIILGAGPSGLIASHFLRKAGIEVVIVAEKGGEYEAGGLKYLHDHEGSHLLLQSLGIRSTVEPVVGRVLWGGRVYPWPTNNPRLNRHLQETHWLKTRGDSPFSPNCMNNQAAASKRGKVKPASSWMKKLADDAARVLEVGSRIERVDLDRPCGGVEVKTVNGSQYTGDVIINTIPLPIFHRVCCGEYWEGKHQQLLALRGRVPVPVDWDYLYLPEGKYTAHRVARISEEILDVEYQVPFGVPIEAVPTEAFWREAGTILTGWCGESMAILKGHLLPATTLPTFPSQAHSLGRYAEWKGKLMVHDVVLKAREIADGLR